MKLVLIVSYDLVNPGQNYGPLIQAIKASDSWARLGGSAYLIATNDEPKIVRDRLNLHLDQNDKLYVGTAPAPAAWFGLPEDVSNWIHANQR